MVARPMMALRGVPDFHGDIRAQETRSWICLAVFGLVNRILQKGLWRGASFFFLVFNGVNEHHEVSQAEKRLVLDALDDGRKPRK
jgi:hypothetical protein